MQLYHSTEVQQHPYGDVSQSDKPIYKQGALSKVKFDDLLKRIHIILMTLLIA